MSNYRSYYFKSLGLKEDSLSGGKGDTTNPSQIDPQQLEMGVKVEMEHTHDADLAREIAMDHLSEDPQYYSNLKNAGMADELPEGTPISATKPQLPMMQKLFSPTAIMPTPVIAVGVRGTKTGLLPAGGYVENPEKARLGGLELVKNPKANSQGAYANTPASDAIKADGGHYTPDNKNISKSGAPVTAVKGDDKIHPMQVQQLGNEPYKDDGTSRDGSGLKPVQPTEPEDHPMSGFIAGDEGDANKNTPPEETESEPRKGPWGIEMDDEEEHTPENPQDEEEDEEDEEGKDVSIDVKENVKERFQKLANIKEISSKVLNWDEVKELVRSVWDYQSLVFLHNTYDQLGLTEKDVNRQTQKFFNFVIKYKELAQSKNPKYRGYTFPDDKILKQQWLQSRKQNTHEAGAVSELKQVVERLASKGNKSSLLEKAQKFLTKNK